MKKGIILAICLLLIAVIAINAKVVYQKDGKELLLQEYKALIAERKQCMKSLKTAEDNLDAQKAVQKRDDTEIEIIKRLLASTQIMVHKRHGEKTRLVVLLKRLLAKLLADQKKNRTKLPPLRKRVEVMKEHCKTKKAAEREGKRALEEIDNAEGNQKKMDNLLKNCKGSLKECRAAAAAQQKKLNGLNKVIAKTKKSYANHKKGHTTCKKALKSQHRHHQNEKKTTSSLKKSKNTHHKNKKSCKSTLANKKESLTTCRQGLTTCQGVNTDLDKSILGQKESNKLCDVELNHCKVSHDKHKAACEKTADKVEDLQENLNTCDANLKKCTPEMTSTTQSLNKCKADKFRLGKQLDFISAKHASIAKELEKYKPLTEVPTKPVIRPKPIIKKRDTIEAPSRTLKRCASTGDPHITNFQNNYFHLYRNFGVFKMVSYKHVLTIYSNVRQSKRYGIRGLNSEVVIGSHSNVISLINYQLKVNGKVVNLKYRTSFAARDGVVVKRNTGHYYTILTPEGAYATVSQHNIGERWAYSNIYAYLPSNYAAKAEGICKAQSPSITLSAANLKKLRPTKAENLFGKTVHVPAITVVRGDPLHDAVPWKSTALKNQATHYCASLKLSPELTVNCLLDAKLAGSLEGAKTYAGLGLQRQLNHKIAHNELKNPAGQTLRELTRLKSIYAIEQSRLTKLRAKLTKVKNAQLVKDTDALLARINREYKFITHLQTVFGEDVLKVNQ